MNPPNPITPGSNLVPATGPVSNPQPLPEVPTYNLVEVQTGASFIPGRSAQGQIGLILQPHENFRVGLNFATNFSSAHDVLAQAGGSFRVTDFLRISILGVGGIGIVSGERSQQGRLQEEVILNGMRYFLGGAVQVDGQVNRWLGLYFQAAALATLNGNLNSTPAQISTREDLNPTGVTLVLSAGARWGFAPRASSQRSEPEQTPPQATPQPPSDANAANNAALIQAAADDINQRIDELQRQMNAQIAEAERTRVNEAINGAQTSINELRGKISRIANGINEINRIHTRLEEVQAELVAPNAILSAQRRGQLEANLARLESALSNPRSGQGEDEIDASLRAAFRYIPNSDPSRPRYINSVIRRLDLLGAALRARNESRLADRVAGLKRQAEAFALRNPEAETVQDLQRNVEGIQTLLQTLENLIGSQNLRENPNWMHIREALTQARDEVGRMYRTTLAYNNLHTHLANEDGFFSSSMIGDARTARAHFEQAGRYLQGLSSADATRGVRLTDLNQQFGYFMDSLRHNLNFFIQEHTRPRMTNAAQLRNWLPAVQAAHALACQVEGSNEACRTSVEGSNPAPQVNGQTPPAGRTSLQRAQAEARTQAAAARRDATAARSAFGSVPAAHADRSRIEGLVREAEAAATAAEAASTSANAAGVNVATASAQATEARRQAGIAAQKLQAVRTAVTATQVSRRNEAPVYVPPQAVTIPAAVCGNGTREAGEACDDGNTANGDTCSSDCHSVTTPPPPPTPTATGVRPAAANGGGRTGTRTGAVNADDL